MKRVIMTVCLLISGCATDVSTIHPDQSNDVMIPGCTGIQQCSEMWSAAREWVKANSVLKIKRDDDMVIQTSNPELRSPDVAYRVIKKPMGNDQYVFLVSAWCGRLSGCWPDALYAKNELNKHLAAQK